MKRRRPTIAERLIDLAWELEHPKGEITWADPESDCFEDGLLDVSMARVKTAVDFNRKPLSFKFRAIYERWSHQRIVRELY